MTDGWADEILEMIHGVDWSSLEHAYGSAELTPVALRAWLSGDDRSPEVIAETDEIFDVIVDYPTPTVAESALAWICVSVFHQGSLYSASAPTCEVMVAALEHSPRLTIRIEALRVLAACFRIYGTDHNSAEWEADGFDPADFRDPAVYDAIEARSPT